MENKECKRYEIDSLDKLINLVNSKNFDTLVEDFIVWLHVVNDTINIMREKYPEQTKNKLNTEIFKFSFIWIDDGKSGLNSINFHNIDTGEIIKIHGKDSNNNTGV
jgi:hypothetical protein